MERSDEQLDPQRLCDAAEAVLVAVVEVSEQLGGTWPYPPDLMGSEVQPACLAGFTKWEVEEASKFLIRLGALDCTKSRRAA